MFETKNEPDTKRRKLDSAIVKDSGGLDKKTFYSQKVKEQGQVYQYVQIVQSLDCTNKNFRVIRPVTTKRGRGRGRGRGVVVQGKMWQSSVLDSAV